MAANGVTLANMMALMTAGFALYGRIVATAPLALSDQSRPTSRMQKQMYEKAKFRLMLTMAISLLTAGCAPRFESHIDSSPMPAFDSPQSATQCDPR